MIVPMRHLTLLCLQSEKKQALVKLAELGVMHVVTTVADTESILSAKAGVEEVQRAITVVGVAASNPWTHLSLKASASSRHGEDPVVREINKLADCYLATKEELRELAQEIGLSVTGMMSSSMFAAIGQVAIPIPVLTSFGAKPTPSSLMVIINFLFFSLKDNAILLALEYLEIFRNCSCRMR